MKNAFTLIEFLICLVIISIIAVFSFYQYDQLKKTKAEQLIIQLQQMIIYAQVQSIAENQAITVCPLDASDICINHWNQVISIFTDADKLHKLNDTGTLLKIMDKQTQLGGVLKFSAFSSARYLTFTPLGLMGQQNGTFIYCENIGTEQIHYGLSISKTGRTRLLWQNDPYFQEAKRC